jgi:hypothetical protein
VQASALRRARYSTNTPTIQRFTANIADLHLSGIRRASVKGVKNEGTMPMRGSAQLMESQFRRFTSTLRALPGKDNDKKKLKIVLAVRLAVSGPSSGAEHIVSCF